MQTMQATQAMQTTQATQAMQTTQAIERTTTGDVTTFALGEAVIVWAPATMPHTRPWDQGEWDKPCPHDWPEWQPELIQEMRKPGCTDEQAETLNELVFRLGSPTGSLVALDRKHAHEYSRRTCHGSIYCIRQAEFYGQGDPDLFDEDVPPSVNKDLEDLCLFVSESVRKQPKPASICTTPFDGGGCGRKRNHLGLCPGQ
jgi:hypothetical protein